MYILIFLLHEKNGVFFFFFFFFFFFGGGGGGGGGKGFRKRGIRIKIVTLEHKTILCIVLVHPGRPIPK